MTKPVRLDPEAEEEIDAAARWYEAQRPGLGLDLIAAVREAVTAIGESPSTFGLAPGVPDALGVRRCAVRRFPYALVSVDLRDEIRVLAAAHYRRRPGYWRGRVL